VVWNDLEVAHRPGARVHEVTRATLRETLFAHMKAAWAGEADRRFLWAPVGLAAGAGVYFSLTFEPSPVLCAGMLTAAACAAYGLRRTAARLPVIVLCLVLAGVMIAQMRTHTLMHQGVVKAEGFVRVEGWIETAERTPRNHTRVMVRVASLSPWSDEPLPTRLRITFRRAQSGLAPGQAIGFRARLFAPRRPVAPGGFDFARRNWFRGIGGTGIAVGDVEPALLDPETPFDIAAFEALGRLRAAISGEIERHLSGPAGAFVVAVVTGQRGGIPEEVTEHLRASGLGHLLAISGLHMALVAGTLFWLVRAVLALSMRATLTQPIKKWAAATALAGGAFYLVLSGASVSTQRAFIMVAIMFAAVILDRPAITMRNVALAALIMLTLRPESVIDVSFQMSFLAVVGLVAVYEFREDLRRGREERRAEAGPIRRIGRRVMLGIAGVAITTLVAGLATGPLAAFHFHRMAVFGTVANLVAVPLMGFVIMPFALLGVIAMPLGLSAPFMKVAEHGVQGVLDVAEWAANLPGAVHHVGAVPPGAALLIVAGILWLCLWRTYWRLMGPVLVAAGVAFSANAPRPDVLVEEEGRVIALRGSDGELALSSSRAARFALERWIAADGSDAPVKHAAAGEDVTCDQDGCEGVLRNGMTVAHVTRARALWDVCRRADIVIARFSISGPCGSAGTVVDRRALWRHGAHAIYVTDTGIKVRTVSQVLGERPWTVKPGSGRNRKKQRARRTDREK